MKTAAMSELKARLREYLDQGKGGTEILITDRGNSPRASGGCPDRRTRVARCSRPSWKSGRLENEILGFFGDHSLRE
jgi:hypothetical protein